MFSCSDVTAPEIVTDNSELVLESRSDEPCEPQGDNCEDAVMESFQITGNFPCSAMVTMEITVCDAEINFEEVQVLPSQQGCVFTLDDVEAAYQAFIQAFMNREASNGRVGNCSFSTTTVSNYIKQSCVQQCQGLGPVGGPFPIILVPCFSGATGCCIEMTRWCENDGTAINIGEDSRVVQGNCVGDDSTPCIAGDPGSAICIADRCEQ